MNLLLEEIYRKHAVADAEGHSICPFPHSIPRVMGKRLYDLLIEEKLENSLEIGMAYGLSTLFLSQAHRDRGSGCHIAIDPYQSGTWKSIGLLNMQRAGLEPLLRFIEAPSYEALPRLLAEGKIIDFAFIDGHHVFDYVLVDFFYVDLLLRKGGFVAFDDLWQLSIRKVVSFVLNNRHYEMVGMIPHSNSAWIQWSLQAMAMKRLIANPFEQTPWKLRCSPMRGCILRKISSDDREWYFHQKF